MKYLVAIVEEGTPISELRSLGEHEVFDSFADTLTESTESAVLRLVESVGEKHETFEVVRIPLDEAVRMTFQTRRVATIRNEVGPL